MKMLIIKKLKIQILFLIFQLLAELGIIFTRHVNYLITLQFQLLKSNGHH